MYISVTRSDINAKKEPYSQLLWSLISLKKEHEIDQVTTVSRGNPLWTSAG